MTIFSIHSLQYAFPCPTRFRQTVSENFTSDALSIWLHVLNSYLAFAIYASVESDVNERWFFRHKWRFRLHRPSTAHKLYDCLRQFSESRKYIFYWKVGKHPHGHSFRLFAGIAGHPELIQKPINPYSVLIFERKRHHNAFHSLDVWIVPTSVFPILQQKFDFKRNA